jgi:hypothetical protein
MTKFEADRKLIEAATPGPWVSNELGVMLPATDDHECEILGSFDFQVDNDFAASARTRWPAALDEIERLRQENLMLRKIAAFVPAKVYILAKENAGYGTSIKPC